jgi:hypothetical protein
MRTDVIILATALLMPLACLATSQEEEPVAPTNLLVVPPAEARPVEGEAPEVRKPADDAGPDAGNEAAAQSGPVPPAFPLSRYQPMWEKSPFQLKSEAPPEMSEGLAQRYVLTGIAEIDGEPIVFLMERATQNRIMVRRAGGEINLVEINIEAKYSDSSAVIRGGGEVGVVKFDATNPASAMPLPVQVQPGGRPRRVGVPGQVPVAQQVPVPGAPAGIPGQMPGVPAVPGQPLVPGMPQVPATPGATQVVVPGENQEAPPPRVIRRRVIIPATP